MSISSISNQKGYTLIELILYVAIIGTLLVGITLFFGATLDSRIKGQSISEVNQQGVAAMEYITQAIRNADSITSPAAGTSGSSLTLATASANPLTINLNGNTLQTIEGVASAVPLTNSKASISGLTFKNLSRSGTPGVVQITFTVSRSSNSNRNEYDYQKTFTSSVALRWP